MNEMASPPAIALARVLLPGEILRWSGRSRRGFLFERSDLYAVPAALLFAGVTAFLISQDWGFTDWVGRLSGLGFAAGALYFATVRFIHDAWQRSRLTYAVTNQRILIIRTGRRPRLRAYELGCLPLFELDEFDDGTGTISFDLAPDPHPFMPPLASTIPPAFLRIREPRAAYTLIRRQTEALRDRGGEAPLVSFIG
jgi:hypothetical protein